MSSYDEGERVFGPPQGSFDADWVVSAARQHDPALDQLAATELVELAWAVLQEVGQPDAAAVARGMLVRQPDAQVSGVNAVAAAAADFVTAYQVPLR